MYRLASASRRAYGSGRGPEQRGWSARFLPEWVNEVNTRGVWIASWTIGILYGGTYAFERECEKPKIFQESPLYLYHAFWRTVSFGYYDEGPRRPYFQFFGQVHFLV